MTIPAAPKNLTLSRITQTTLYVTFSTVGISSTTILERQISWGLTVDANSHHVVSDGSTTLTGLPVAQRIYVKVRVRNASGWGYWSPAKNALLIAGAYVFVAGRDIPGDIIYTTLGKWKRAIPYVKVDGVWKVASPRVRIFGLWKGTG